MIDSAMRGADRAAMLTQRLLAFSRRQPLAPTPIDVNRARRRHVGAAASARWARRSSWNRCWPPACGALRRTPTSLENALLNLAVNARDAMPDGGKLTIETANAFLDEAYAQRQRPEEIRPGQYVMIAVTDTGTGMSQEVLAKVFEPFFTTKDIGQGTGLGLSQVYGFVQQSGGHVAIYSELGQGTTVKLYLPRLARVRCRGRCRGDRGPGGAGGQAGVTRCWWWRTRTTCADSASRRCGARLRRVRGRGSGMSALRYLRDAAGILRLLFTDVGLPGGLNGRQLADAARRRGATPEGAVSPPAMRATRSCHHGRLEPASS